MNPSPRAHIYRLLLALVVLLVVFLGIRALAIPSSWDSERWYRQESLTDIQQLPIRFGGNGSCATSECHEPTEATRHDEKRGSLDHGQHKGLACEVCHGPLVDHAKNGEKSQDAKITVANELCMSCHRQALGRPEQFAQFSTTQIYHKVLKVRERSLCRACHDPHDPT